MTTPAKKPPIIELWETSRLIPYEHNARIISQAAVEKVAASIREFGFKQPIVVDKDGVIVAGHTRLLAAQRLKVKRVPVIVASDLTDAQAKAYRLMDNRSAQETTWEYGMLNIELEELAGLEVNLALTGFDAGELAGLPMWGKTGESAAEEFGNVRDGVEGFKRFWYGAKMQTIRRRLRQKDRAGTTYCARCCVTFSRCDFKHWTDAQVGIHWDGIGWRRLEEGAA